ncbi:bifunctional 3,4-dihydroxy-2-butanone-4-phosphate synthase/GTP cyclohydrolase II [Zobellella taiwanensis]|jgi:3,4-dihydroxy 2-butanone 4-phosphate synthase/GTP cyclohydrolase II|uniref:3,4-dihydroxy-2-butanone 4-phosphate synthase n=1 Tax=Zobellella taiwanensis TaxID=347535 RepID=A0A2P7R5C3_9GAMM|nr:bifunctional 3,4-dihydroxy-2-butanone-4-phosphate synthase/GTP cyclohydrolase II [Zobellella taiwanensis]PSJ45411.1 3,4-dihydroxy-2-butanone-4-phosphate synthase [Zobellella taiwanensis]
MALSSTQEIIDDIRQGKMVILMDDEDRENEGDLIMAAEHVRPEDINFMAKFGRGLICLTLTEARCRQLDIPQMVSRNTEQFSTAFTVSIEAAEGVTTGISAADRARTVQAAVAKDAKPADLVQPGHIFPLKAQNGGVLTRAGHTEAGCDLARLAGLEPAAVIVEILNEDGTMARRPDLEKFAEQHGIKLGTIADLIEYRNQNETTIEQVARCKLPTEHGEFELVTFRDTIDNQVHFALRKGEIKADQPALVRVHIHDMLTDVLMTDRHASRSWPLDKSMARIADEGGVLVILGKEETPDHLLSVVRMFEAADKGERPEAAKRQGTSRRVGVGSQILRAMGVGKMRLLSSPKRYHALSGFGLEVVEYVTE